MISFDFPDEGDDSRVLFSFSFLPLLIVLLVCLEAGEQNATGRYSLPPSSSWRQDLSSTF